MGMCMMRGIIIKRVKIEGWKAVWLRLGFG
jgi:hypothetical protein